MEGSPMVRLTTADSAFAARVLAARLGADGIVCELRGSGLDVVYPTGGPVDVYVSVEDFELARDLLEPAPADLEVGGTARPVSFVPAWVWTSAIFLLGLFAFLLLRNFLDMVS